MNKFKYKQLIELIDYMIEGILSEVILPNQIDIKKFINTDDVKDYYGNTPYNQKLFKLWANDEGDYKDAEIFKGRITGTYSTNNLKFGLRQTIGKSKTILGYIYIPKKLYYTIIQI